MLDLHCCLCLLCEQLVRGEW